MERVVVTGGISGVSKIGRKYKIILILIHTTDVAEKAMVTLKHCILYSGKRVDKPGQAICYCSFTNTSLHHLFLSKVVPIHHISPLRYSLSKCDSCIVANYLALIAQTVLDDYSNRTVTNLMDQSFL